MIALDTCVLVRLLSDDDSEQVEQAQTLLRSHTVFLPTTVLLETEWVLRSRYKKSREELTRFFRLLLDLENVVLEDADRFQKAVGWYSLGADFADALHLSACDNQAMYTFDRDFCRPARGDGSTPEVRVIEA